MALILVVDDDTAVREMVAATLENAGHTVISAANGKEAGRMFQTAEFDLVITDMVMPERDGLEIIMGLRRDGKKLPIIAISGLSDNSPLFLNVAQKLGASRTLGKPFTCAELLAVTNDVLATAKP